MNLRKKNSIARDALGLGLRTPFYQYVQEHKPELGYFEIISENFMTDAYLPKKNLMAISEHYPLVLHGVGLNLLGAEALDEHYLDQLCRLADLVDAAFVSDHLCWTASAGHHFHDLLPVPYKRELVDLAVSRAAWVQKRLGRPFALENLSSYVSFDQSEMSEWEFYRSVVEQADCSFMLDINNIYVSSQNHGFDPRSYIDAIDFERVVQVHIAGHERQADQTIIDTHDQPVAEAVWDLYRYAWDRGGPFPTLLEWDDKIPPLADVLAELEKAKRMRIHGS